MAKYKCTTCGTVREMKKLTHNAKCKECQGNTFTEHKEEAVSTRKETVLERLVTITNFPIKLQDPRLVKSKKIKTDSFGTFVQIWIERDIYVSNEHVKKWMYNLKDHMHGFIFIDKEGKLQKIYASFGNMKLNVNIRPLK